MNTPTKVTREHLGMRIAAADYVVMPDGRTTVCQLTMQNGFTVRGESSCVSIENFNKELGEKYAYEKAFDNAWAFEGYLLAELRHREARGDENQHREEQEKVRREVLLELMDMFKVSDVDALLRRARTLSSMVPTGSFGWALERLKAGNRVARQGWNGKGMWLSISCDGSREVAAENFWSPHNAEFARQNGGKALVLPAITMKTVDSTGREAILIGWLASQTDMLADDWVIVK